MKKLLLVLIISLVSITTFAQKTMTAYKSARGVWSDSREEFVFDEPVSSDITFKMYSDIITADDRAHSIYRVQSGGKLVKTQKFNHIKWNCLDEEDIACNVVFMIDNLSGTLTLNVIYKNICFMYFLNNSNTD